MCLTGGPAIRVKSLNAAAKSSERLNFRHKVTFALVESDLGSIEIKQGSAMFRHCG